MSKVVWVWTGGIILLAVIVSIVGWGVFRRDGSELDLPPTSVFAECEQYAVAEGAHVPLYADPLHTADIIYISRRGELFSIIDKDIDQKQYYDRQGPWYLLAFNEMRGWGFGPLLTTHCYRYHADLQQQILEKKHGQ